MILNFNIKNNFHRAISDGKSFTKVRQDTGEYTLYSDPGQVYRANSYGYRSNEFTVGTDLLAAGCSFTFGVGVPEETIWANVIAKNLGVSVSNISRPGASVLWIVERVFTYFEKFGHPKYLMCLFPDEARTVMVVDGEILSGPGKQDRKGVGDYGTIGGTDDSQYLAERRTKSSEEFVEMPSYIKRPYSADAVYTSEQAMYHSVRSIRRLEQYCKLANIKLFWSTWDPAFLDQIIEINKEEDLKFDNFFDIKLKFYKKPKDELYLDAIFYTGEELTNCNTSHNSEEKKPCSCYLTCHEDLLEAYGEDNFHSGTDTGNGAIFAHPGIHLQAHYADRFIEQLMLEYPHEFK